MFLASSQYLFAVLECVEILQEPIHQGGIGPKSRRNMNFGRICFQSCLSANNVYVHLYFILSWLYISILGLQYEFDFVHFLILPSAEIV